MKKLILSTALTICSLALCSSQGTATKNLDLNDPAVLRATVEHIKKNVTFDNFEKVANSASLKLKISKAYLARGSNISKSPHSLGISISKASSLPLGINIYCKADLSPEALKSKGYEVEKLMYLAMDIIGIARCYVIDTIDHVFNGSSITKANVIDVDSKHESITIPGIDQYLLVTNITNAKGYSRAKFQLHNLDGSFASPILKNIEENCIDQNPDKILISKSGKFLMVQFSNFNGPNGHWNSYKYSFYKKRNFNYLKFDHQIFIQAILNEFAKTGLPVHVPDNLRYMLKALPDKVQNLLFENGYLAGSNKYSWFNEWQPSPQRVKSTAIGVAAGAIAAAAWWYKLI